jgi:diacylglycerol kinase (ATP)
LKLLLVFNPHAAVGRAARLLPALRMAMRPFATLEVLETRGNGDAADRVARADLAGFDGLIAAGGDGTLFEVLNGLYAHPADRRIPLGVVPVGTGNAFARDLGLRPGDWEKGVGIVRAGRQRRVDVGRVTHADGAYHFLNIVGAGLPVDAMRTAERLKFLGQSAYSLAALWRAMRLQTYPLGLEIDGEAIEQEALFVEVSNSRYTGTSFLMAPGAEFDDGLLDVTVLRRLSRRRLLRLFPTIYHGRHVEYAEVLTRRAQCVRLLAPSGLQLAPDGEFCGTLPATVECLPGDLAIFA